MIPIWLKIMLRRVFNLGSARELTLILLCLWGTYLQVRYRVPGLLPFLVLPWLGFALTAVTSLSLAVRLLGHIPTKDPLRREFKLLQRIYQGILVVFIGYSVVLYLNCRLDISDPVEQKSVVLDISEGEFDIGWFVTYARADLRSWNNPSEVKPVLLHRNEFDSLWIKEPVLVRTREGANGIEWIESIEEDEEIRMQQVLKIAPTAAAAWRKLIWFYMDRRRWDGVVHTAKQYFNHYPDDAKTAEDIAGVLFTHRQFSAHMQILNSLIDHRQDFNLYQRAAWQLGQEDSTESKQRALKLALSSIEMEPENPQGYYTLGHVYYWSNKPQEALITFEKYLTIWPGTPDVEQIAEQLRKQLKSTQSYSSR